MLKIHEQTIYPTCLFVLLLIYMAGWTTPNTTVDELKQKIEDQDDIIKELRRGDSEVLDRVYEACSPTR